MVWMEKKNTFYPELWNFKKFKYSPPTFPFFRENEENITHSANSINNSEV